MARTVNPDEYALKRNQIIEAALRQMIARGFHNLVIRDILAEIQISSGAFHHYFDSRNALLEAVLQRILQQTYQHFTVLVQDPELSALQKLQGFFATIDNTRAAHRQEAGGLIRVWYCDDNAPIRKKMDEMVFRQRAPLLNEIVRQGIREGVFTCPYPDHAGAILLSMLQGMAETHLQQLNRAVQTSDQEVITGVVEDISAAHAAYMDAIERVLGAPGGCLYRAGPETAGLWVNALRENS